MKAHVSAVGCMPLLGIGLCRWDGRLILFRDPNEEAECFIYRIRVRKSLGHVRLQPDDIAESFATRPQFSYAQGPQIVFRPKFVSHFRFNLLHNPSAPQASPLSN